MPVRIKRTGLTAGVMLREQNRISREVALRIGEFWYDRYFENHFTPKGAREYGYEPRSGEKGSGRRFQGSYHERKWKESGHGKPLMFSGKSYDFLKIPRLRITSTRGVATLRILLGAPAFNLFGKGGRYGTSKVDMRHDITAVTDQEKQEMAEYAGSQFMERYKSLRGRMAA